MQVIEATGVYRKSGGSVVEGPAVLPGHLYNRLPITSRYSFWITVFPSLA
jgi:hypothetical protein